MIKGITRLLKSHRLFKTEDKLRKRATLLSEITGLSVDECISRLTTKTAENLQWENETIFKGFNQSLKKLNLVYAQSKIEEVLQRLRKT